MRRLEEWPDWATGEWIAKRTTAFERRVIHYWFTVFWFTIGFAIWIVVRNVLWFVGFMSLYAIWISHLTGLSAETPVEIETDGEVDVEHADQVIQQDPS